MGTYPPTYLYTYLHTYILTYLHIYILTYILTYLQGIFNEAYVYMLKQLRPPRHCVNALRPLMHKITQKIHISKNTHMYPKVPKNTKNLLKNIKSTYNYPKIPLL